MAQTNYDSKDIVVLEGLDAVRMRPGMYIGTTGLKGLHHLLWEIVDNSIDELSNGYGNKISVTINTDGSVTVDDNGRGIPVDIHPTLKKSGVEVVFTKLHAGGKFGNSNYGFSGGLHGVGASVTNALSEWLNVNVHRDKKIYSMSFASIADKSGKVKSGVALSPLKEVGTTSRTGTVVSFLPDARIFKDLTFNYEIISKRLKELAFLNKGIVIEFNDKRIKKQDLFCYEGGLSDFILYINEGKNTLFKKPIYITGESNVLKLELAIQHTDAYTENIFSFVNNIPTSEGGTHETGLKTALTKCLNDYARATGVLKDKDPNFMGEDFREGLTAVFAIKMTNVQFEGQTKTKLGNPEAKTEVENILAKEFAALFKQAEYTKTFEEILNKAKKAARVRLASKKAKELARAKNSIDNYNLVGKLAASTSRNKEKSELFIVEGDSAGGSAKMGRDRTIQAILPLKGKPLNAEKKRIDQVLANDEIRTIISALETGIGEDFNLDDLRYHKVIILSDADQDGAHIRAILVTFFFRYMKELVTNGHLYIGLSPLYKVYNNKTEKYVYDEKDLEKTIEEVGRGYQIQRYKGLGEMNPEQLWETTMNPETRTLIQVGIEDATEADRIITVLMGDNIEERKNYIAQHANFNKEESLFEKIKK
ncbi:MAG: DNA gyrase/topoisomerase IV subunit B [Christensenellales bacterium]